MNETMKTAGPVTGWRLAFLCMLLWCALLPRHGSAAEPTPDPPAPVQVMHEAEFSDDDGANWSQIALPDTWALRGLKPRGSASYRVQLTLVSAPTQMWALRADRVSSTHVVVVNGRLVHLGSGKELSDGRPIAQLIDLPPGLLRAGTNDIRIDLDYRNRAGLSTLEIGPRAELQPAFSGHVALTETLPEGLNIAGATFGLFMCAIWWRRRSETAIGWFGALCVLVSVRNYCYFVVNGMPMPEGFSNWAFYMAQVGTALLFGAFALALSGRRARWFERALKATAIVLPLCSFLAVGPAAQHTLRALTYPMVIALSLTSLWLVAAHALRVRQFVLLVLPSGLAMVLLSGVHDYLYQQGFGSVLGGYWMPYATPVALFSFALVLVNRLVQALTDVELLNASLERRVADRTREVEIANTAKTRFLAAASHDMRQPVVTIGLLVGLAREQLTAMPALRTMLDRIHEAVVSLELLLKGLMDLSRLESGTITPRLQAVPLQPLFDAIDLQEQTAALLNGVHLRFRAQSLSVMSDPVLLDQIVRNLVSNAVRYTEHGGVLVSARRRRRGTVLLQVWDTGRGIPSEAQGQVFEEFVQLDNPGRDRSKGLGLGLAIVQRSVRLLGARLSLRSVPGRGSCFTLELPVAPQGADAPPPPPPAALPLLGMPVWLIEDNAAVRDALSTRLQHWGAQVRALTGRGDVERLLATAEPLPWLIVSDQRLPDGSGLDCIALIRARAGAALPAVIVTGDTAPGDLALLAAAGLPVLHKPFGAEALLARLQLALEATPEATREAGPEAGPVVSG